LINKDYNRATTWGLPVRIVGAGSKPAQKKENAGKRYFFNFKWNIAPEKYV